MDSLLVRTRNLRSLRRPSFAAQRADGRQVLPQADGGIREKRVSTVRRLKYLRTEGRPIRGQLRKLEVSQSPERSSNNLMQDGNTPGAFFNRRELDASEFPPADEHECGGQGLHSIVRKVVGPVSEEKVRL